MALGGGGHPGAGGCHMPGDLVTTKNVVTRALDMAFNRQRTSGVMQSVRPPDPREDSSETSHTNLVAIKAPSDEET